jgi:phosphate transport system substrate-binding protein
MRQVVDKLRHDSLHSLRFVTPGGGLVGVWAAGLALAAGFAGACSPQSASRPVEDSLTSGRIQIVAAGETFRLVSREIEAFEGLYPNAEVDVRAGTSRQAVADLFAARADVAVIGRELEPEERAAAVRGRLDVEGYRFARDAVVLVVHPGNAVENVTLEDVRGIYEGTLTRWSQLGGSDLPVVPVVQPPTSDATAFLIEEALNGEPMRARAVLAGDDSSVVAAVASSPGAIGYVSLGHSERGARALRVATVLGLPFWKPDAETVYRGDYPLTRYLNLYVRASGPRVANGFVTYVTSGPGQRLVHESGLVPTTIPVRFVRRSPMQSTHGRR